MTKVSKPLEDGLYFMLLLKLQLYSMEIGVVKVLIKV